MLKVGKTIEIVEKPIQNKSYSDIKKIDFEKLENEINNPETIKSAKSETKKDFFIFNYCSSFFMDSLFVSSSLKWPDFFFCIFIFINCSIASTAYIFVKFIDMINPKRLVEKILFIVNIKTN